MPLSSLTAISPVDGRYASQTESMRVIFSECGLMRYRILVEARWLQCLAANEAIAEVPALSGLAQHVLQKTVDEFGEPEAERIKDIERSTNHDVKAVEYFLKERFADNQELSAISEFVHFGCTSEDVNNLAYAMMLRDARAEVIIPQVDDVISRLRELAHTHAEQPMLARTHGQPASPTTLGKELANFVYRLVRQREQLANVTLSGKMNGAVGNFNAHVVAYPELPWPEIAQGFVESLGFSFNPYTTQIDPHDCIAELFHALIRLHTVLLDVCRDLWGYIALGYFQQAVITDEVGSSTMPHKVNPIHFENAEGNLGLANAQLAHMAEKLPTSRWQRDLSDSTVLRNMGYAIGLASIAYQSIGKGLSRLAVDQQRLDQELNANWEVLGEAIQTVMRRYGIEKPYEKLRALSRGRRLEPTQLLEFVEELPLPDEAKQRLRELTPSNYLGHAAELARNI